MARLKRVGDRLENDIAPARAHGWQTWQFTSQDIGPNAGDWDALRRRLQALA